MANQATGKKPPAKERNPSRLRHEIRPVSTDDDGDNQEDFVQAPHSDTIVCNTQLDISRHATGRMESKCPELDLTEPPLSPKSRVTLERFVATKKTSVPGSDASLFRTFRKEPVEPSRKLALHTQAFSYGQVIRTTSQMDTNIGPFEPQPTAHTTSPSSTKDERSDQEAHESIEPATTADRASHETPIDTQDVGNATFDGELTPSNPLPRSPATDGLLKKPSQTGSTHWKTATLLSLASQVDSRSKSEKTKSSRYGQHERKMDSLPICDHAKLWLPRRIDALDDAQLLTNVNETLPSDSINVSYLVKLEKRDDQSKDLNRDDAISLVTSHDSRKPTTGYKPNTQKDIKAKHGTEADSATEEVPQKILPDSLDTLASPWMAMSSLPPVPVVTDSAQHKLQEDHNETSRYHQDRNASNEKAPSSLFESHNDTLPCPGGSGHSLHDFQSPAWADETSQPPTAQPPTAQPPTAQTPTSQSPTAQPITSQNELHRTSDRGVPSRIVKTRPKSRTDNKSTSHGVQGLSISPVVDRALKNLEMAFLAESFRKTHDHTTELEHAAEKVALHLQTIDLQKETIVDLRKQRDELKTAFENHTRKAKTNQKFLEGLQKDYEKLKTLTTTAQEDNKKVVQSKIAEVEEEKHALRREIEMIACKLAESQRKIRAVADELYVKLAITLSANESLTKRRDELEEAYNSERKKREDVESGLLDGIQTLQSQFSDTSNALINKLKQFQTSVEKTVIPNHQDTKINECLEILNSLKTAPLLKVQDVRKAEGMLCFVRTRVESGLEDLRKAIIRSSSPNADHHTSINEQLKDLRINIVKYEELAAENCKIKESNVALIQQLEAQRQECARLNERVEHLEQAEIDLSDRSTKLERELGSMEGANHFHRSQILEIEQTNRGLRQRLEEVESELVVTKVKADDTEKSRRNLEAQAVEYKKRYEAAVKQQMAEKQDAAAAYEKLSEDFKLKFSEKQEKLQSEIGRLKVALHDEEAARQKLSKDLSIANTHLEELRKTSNDQEAANKKLKAQVSQQQSSIYVMREKADEMTSQNQQEADQPLLLAQNKALSLESERKTLLCELSEARENEHRTGTAEKAISAEKARLHEEIRDMHLIINTKDAEIAQTHSECTNEHHKVIEQYRHDVEDYKRRLAETNISLKEVEMNAKLMEDHYRAKIAAEQKLAESKLLELENEYRNALQLAKEQNVPLKLDGTQDASSNPFMSHPDKRLSTAKGQKRVERDNQSVIEAIQEQDHFVEFPVISQPEGSQLQSDDQDLFATFICDIDNSLQDKADNSLMENYGCDSASTTQNLGAPSFSQALFTQRSVEAAMKESQDQVLSSSRLSSMASDELARIQKEVEPALTSMLDSRDAGSYRLETLSNNDKAGISHADNISVTSSHSSQSRERPRSQANTSSRMVPPHGSTSKQTQPPLQSQIIRIKPPSQHQKLDSILQDLSGSASPDKRKVSTGQTDGDLSPKRQRGMLFTQPAFSSSGPWRRSQRLSRGCVGDSGLAQSDASHTKGDLLKASHSRSEGRSSENRSHSSNYTSSDRMHLSRQQLTHISATPSKRYSSRTTRNQSRKGTASEDEFNDRFNEELQGFY